MSASNWQNLLYSQDTVCKGVLGMWYICFPTSTSGKKRKWQLRVSIHLTYHSLPLQHPLSKIAFCTYFIFQEPTATMLDISNFLYYKQKHFTSPLKREDPKSYQSLIDLHFPSESITFPPWYPGI